MNTQIEVVGGRFFEIQVQPKHGPGGGIGPDLDAIPTVEIGGMTCWKVATTDYTTYGYRVLNWEYIPLRNITRITVCDPGWIGENK